jgi:hypothetical protein
MVAEMLRDRVLQREDRRGGEGEEIAVGLETASCSEKIVVAARAKR